MYAVLVNQFVRHPYTFKTHIKIEELQNLHYASCFSILEVPSIYVSAITKVQ
jgi:hypothetical protein